MKIPISPGKTGNVISTIAIGREYYDAWKKYALPNWERYCRRYNLGLIVFDSDLISKTDRFWKKATWQKLLIGDVLKSESPAMHNVCYLDSDVLINPTAPNIFDGYDPSTIGLVSLRKNLPYPLENTLRRLAFLRNRYYDSNYPLDSALFISDEELFKYHNLTPQEDFSCAGFFVFNVKASAELLKSFFFKYDKNVESITGGGDQTHFNYEIQKNSRVSWLDYRFQAIWTFEIAWKYPFLYSYCRNNTEIIRECIEASLFTNYFLHFAGSWYESDMWKLCSTLVKEETQERFEDFKQYLKMSVTGKPKGQVKPLEY